MGACLPILLMHCRVTLHVERRNPIGVAACTYKKLGALVLPFAEEMGKIIDNVNSWDCFFLMNREDILSDGVLHKKLKSSSSCSEVEINYAFYSGWSVLMRRRFRALWFRIQRENLASAKLQEPVSVIVCSGAFSPSPLKLHLPKCFITSREKRLFPLHVKYTFDAVYGALLLTCWLHSSRFVACNAPFSILHALPGSH